jgi:hypothetical protein
MAKVNNSSKKPAAGAADLKSRVATPVFENTLFGVVEKTSAIPRLKDRYAHQPFNVIDTRQGDWNKNRRPWRVWLKLKDTDDDDEVTGITGEAIEQSDAFEKFNAGQGIAKIKIAEEAVFDPLLLEVLSDWYCPEGGSILDFFNGSHVSGCVFQRLGYSYTGIDVRQKIIEKNMEKVMEIIPENPPRYLCGNSKHVLDDLIFEQFDMINSCPPYAFLVKYSKDNPVDGDISLLDYDPFIVEYREIIRKGVYLLKDGGYACITIGQVRDPKTGELLPFMEDTIKAFKDCGMKHWNEVPLIGSYGSAAMRAKGTFERGMGKLVNVHQTVLIFKKC